eukprot:29060-Pelagococcus_subviridis.AAC.1
MSDDAGCSGQCDRYFDSHACITLFANVAWTCFANACALAAGASTSSYAGSVLQRIFSIDIDSVIRFSGSAIFGAFAVRSAPAFDDPASTATFNSCSSSAMEYFSEPWTWFTWCDGMPSS